jgi:hypothetical protein
MFAENEAAAPLRAGRKERIGRAVIAIGRDEHDDC